MVILLLQGCRWVKLDVDPEPPRQGDNVVVTITAGEGNQIDEIHYSINGRSGTASTVPHTVNVSTCKNTGEYITSLTLWAQVTYSDGKTYETSKEFDLTVCDASRESNRSQYAVYVAHDEKQLWEDTFVYMANAFQDKFDSYSNTQYYWADPFLYTDPTAGYANGTDMLISIGHGRPLYYSAGITSVNSNIVDLSRTAYGSFARCSHIGQIEYLVFGSCSVLSMKPFKRWLFRGGMSWGSNAYTTAISFGNVDDDAAQEVGITRYAGMNDRYWILDDAAHNFQVLASGGAGWGSNGYATSIAFGNVDGDAMDEVGITRKSGTNDRYWIIDDKLHGFQTLASGGASWGSNAYATSIAFGNVDGDAMDEVGITRKSGTNDRYWIMDDKLNGFQTLASGGSSWGSGAYATSIAFGNVDGDAMDEVGITRESGTNDRYWIMDDKLNGFQTLSSGGASWGSNAYATAVAFGDVDGDGMDEVGIARKSSTNDRYWIMDDRPHGFQTLASGGSTWGQHGYTTAMAFGDVDNDGRDEVGITRHAGTNQRYWILDDKLSGFRTIVDGGEDWEPDRYITCVAFGDVGGDGAEEFGFGFNAGGGSRFEIIDSDKLGYPYAYGWLYSGISKIDARPFSGLHMTLGFRTLFSINGSEAWDNTGVDLFRSFANKLDYMMSVREAWMDAVGDRLSFDDNCNRGAVIYLKPYENDNVLSVQPDYVFGNSHYFDAYIEYYE